MTAVPTPPTELLTDVGSELRELMDDGALTLPPPGSGDTAERHLALFDLARRRPVSVARLAEAHTDAVAILAEAGDRPVPGAIYGVWASGSACDVTLAETDVCAEWAARPESRLDGTKSFCSGLGVVDRALVAVDTPGVRRPLLLDVAVVPGDTLRPHTDAWCTAALRETRTGAAEFLAHPVDRSPIGPAGWYLDRVGFWHGACGPAACWAGAATGLVDAAEALVDSDPHRRAHLGGLRAAAWAMRSLLSSAGHQIDRCPTDVDAARLRALSLRHTIERLASEVLDRFGRALGPRPFVSDPSLDQRFAETHLYLRQHHDTRDLETLGRS